MANVTVVRHNNAVELTDCVDLTCVCGVEGCLSECLFMEGHTYLFRRQLLAA